MKNVQWFSEHLHTQNGKIYQKTMFYQKPFYCLKLSRNNQPKVKQKSTKTRCVPRLRQISPLDYYPVSRQQMVIL